MMRLEGRSSWVGYSQNIGLFGSELTPYIHQISATKSVCKQKQIKAAGHRLIIATTRNI